MSLSSWPGLSRPPRLGAHDRASLIEMAGTSPAMTKPVLGAVRRIAFLVGAFDHADHRMERLVAGRRNAERPGFAQHGAIEARDLGLAPVAYVDQHRGI